MEENRQHIDKLFREELGNYTELPAPEVWASLDKKLDAHYKKAPTGGSSYSWLWYVLLAVLAALLYYGVKSFTTGKMASQKPAPAVENSTSVSTVDNSPDPGLTNNSTAEGGEAEKNENSTEGTTNTDVSALRSENKNAVSTQNNKTKETKTSVATVAANNKKEHKAQENTSARKSFSTGKTDAEGTGENNSSKTPDKATTPASHKTAVSNKSKKVTSSKISKEDEGATNTDALVAKNKADKSQSKQRASRSGKSKRSASSEIDKTNTEETASKDVATSEDKAITPASGQKPKALNKSQNRTSSKRSNKDAEGTDKPTASAPKKDKTATDEIKGRTSKQGSKKTSLPAAVKTTDNIKQAEQDNAVKDKVAASAGIQPHTSKRSPAKAHAKKSNGLSVKQSANPKANDEGQPLAQQTTNDPLIKSTTPKSATSNTQGKGARKTEHNYAGRSGAENNNSKGSGNKSGNKKTKPVSNNTTAKTGTPNKKNNKAATQNLSDNNEEPHQSFADNKTMPKKPTEPKTNKPTDKPTTEWQKGFNADDSRGLKTVKGGSANNDNNDAGSDDAAKSNASAAKGGGGGGGSTSSGEEDKKKDKHKDKKKFDFSAGIKAGFEKGFSSYQANKIVIAPYFQYNLAENIGLVLQPSLKYAMLNKTQLSDPQSYYRISGSKIDSNHINIPGDTVGKPDSILRRYYYSQSHDSIVASTRIAQKRYYEFELPVMLQYKLSKTFSAYVGVTMNYSKIVQVTNDLKEYNGLTRYDSSIYKPVNAKDPAPVPVYPAYFSQFSGTPYSQYTANVVANATTTNQLRFSYTIGLTYLFGNRFLFDVMFVKMLSDPGYIPDKNVKDIYKQGYLRLSLGYKFK